MKTLNITYIIFNSIDQNHIMRIKMPWGYRKAINGFYSRLWIDLKVSCASLQKIDKRFVRCKVIRGKDYTDRFEIMLPNGVKFNSPFDLKGNDFKIIDLHLEALKLSIS